MNFSDHPFRETKQALLDVVQSIKAPRMDLRATEDQFRALKAYHAELLAMVEATLRTDLAEAKARAIVQPDMSGLDDFLTEAAKEPFGLFEQLDDLASDAEGESLGFGRRAA